jgi:hypothetical protein
MSSEDLSAVSQGSATVPTGNVVLSPYVNEPFPCWDVLLSAHDVARLTRRPRWVLAGLAFVGQFPRKYRYRGRAIGWLRADVFRWLTRSPASYAKPCGAARRPQVPCQISSTRHSRTSLRSRHRGKITRLEARYRSRQLYCACGSRTSDSE